MSQFIESIRWEDGQYHLLKLHEERMHRTLKDHFGLTDDIDLSMKLNPPDIETSLVKARVIYDHEDVRIEYQPYQRKIRSHLKLVCADTIEYTYKAVDRSLLDQLYNSTQADDILIVKNGLITDAYYSNVVFFDGENWITPDTPLLNGVMRSYLLDHDQIKEAPVSLKTLKTYQGFKLINALNPWSSAPMYSMKILS